MTPNSFKVQLMIVRRIIALEYLTLDGFVATTDGKTGWFVWDEEVDSYYIEFQASIDTLLFGRMTYETIANYWSTSKASAENPEMVGFMNKVRKIVFSRKAEKLGWHNVEVRSRFVIEEFVEMKKQSGQDIAVYGSGSIVSQLAKADLIDEYRIMLNPVVIGSGIPLFQDLQNEIELNLLNARTFGCGNTLLCYEPAVRSKGKE